MGKAYTENLSKQVLEKSFCKTDWHTAVQEWKVTDVEEDEESKSSCICGKENLRYLYTITNSKTNNTLFPIGSRCIQKFERKDLDKYTSITESMFALMHAIRDEKFITLNSEFFSRKLLQELYSRSVFLPNDHNGQNGFNDYKFLLDMFNKKDKDSITEKQKKKIGALVAYVIRPWLEDKFGSKVKSKSDN
jgi:hypothetical protein